MSISARDVEFVPVADVRESGSSKSKCFLHFLQLHISNNLFPYSL